MASLGPFGDTEYTPSLPSIAHALGISYGQAQLSLIDHYFGWQYNFHLLTTLAVLMLALFFCFPETNRKLNRDAAKPRVFIKTYLYLLRQPVYL
jgi:predicted MFS family arabinose efflux permease